MKKQHLQNSLSCYSFDDRNDHDSWIPNKHFRTTQFSTMSNFHTFRFHDSAIYHREKIGVTDTHGAQKSYNFNNHHFHSSCLQADQKKQKTWKSKNNDYETLQHRKLKGSTKAASENDRKNKNSKKKVKLLTLSQCTAVMNNLLEQKEALEKPPIHWISASHDNNMSEIKEEKESLQQRYQLFLDTKTLASAMKQSINEGSITASSGKDIYELSSLLGNFLLLYSESPPTRLLHKYNHKVQSPYEACLQITEILQNLNLDVQPNNYESIIRTACHEHQWDDAADYFLNQINPDASGWVPMDSTLGWNQPVEMGLYAVSMMVNQQKNDIKDEEIGSAADVVFNAVLDMCIISPTDQEKYILAAGAALGRAGLWKECIRFAESNNEIRTKFGRSLIAAAMTACIECMEYDVAIQFYDEMAKDPSVAGSEWQWGGDYNGSTVIHPLCRDLIIQAIGNSDRVKKNTLTSFYNSDFVWKLLEQILHDEAGISSKALAGAFQAFERDYAWEKSLKLLQHIIVHRNPENCFLILEDDDSMNFFVNSNEPIQSFRSELSSKLEMFDRTEISLRGKINANMTASILRTCNQSEYFGLAILCYHIISFSNRSNEELSALVPDSYKDSLDFFLPGDFQSFLLQDRDCFVALNDSLRGLGCEKDAADMQYRVEKVLNSSDSYIHTKIVNSTDNTIIERNEVNSIDARYWHKHVYKMAFIIEAMRRNTYSLKSDRQKILLKSLSDMMNCSCDLGHPYTALFTAQLVALTMSYVYVKPTAKKRTVQNLLQTFFDIPLSSDDLSNTSKFGTMENSLLQPLFTSDDETFSATINVMSLTGNHEDALDLFFSKMEHDEKKGDRFETENVINDFQEQSKWILSKRIVLEVLLRNNQLNDAIDYFESMSEFERDPKCYISLARALCDSERWVELQSIYTKAQESGCMSESLGLIVMGGLSKPRIKDKVKVLRSISEYIASLSGMTSDDWIRSRYWKLKGIVGYHYARLLLWVKDPSETQQKELELALSELQDSQINGSVVNQDALRCIVRVAGHGQRSSQSKSIPAPEAIGANEREKQKNERSEAINLIKRAYSEASTTPLGIEPSFIEEVASGLRAMKANRDCVEIVRTAIQRGVHIKSTTTQIAFAAADASNDSDLINETYQLLSNTGFSSMDNN